MVRVLEIKNFKSIRSVRLNCRRVNVLIGEPNTGKSNLLEGLGLFSLAQIGGDPRNFIRMEDMSDWFYGKSVEREIAIRADNLVLEVTSSPDEKTFMGFGTRVKRPLFRFNYDFSGKEKDWEKWKGKHEPGFRFYRFIPKITFSTQEREYLLPPHGSNLLALLLSNSEIQDVVKNLLTPFGFTLNLRRFEEKIEVMQAAEKDEMIFFSYPYSLLSDTIQRLIFYHTTITSNQKAVIIFEEPEAHAFPRYTKLLGERIALDKNRNQYFLTTHNPYLLLSLVEKTPKRQLAVFVFSMKGYATEIKQLSEAELEEILGDGLDVFFNIERFIGED